MANSEKIAFGTLNSTTALQHQRGVATQDGEENYVSVGDESHAAPSATIQNPPTLRSHSPPRCLTSRSTSALSTEKHSRLNSTGSVDSGQGKKTPAKRPRHVTRIGSFDCNRSGAFSWNSRTVRVFIASPLVSIMTQPSMNAESAASLGKRGGRATVLPRHVPRLEFSRSPNSLPDQERTPIVFKHLTSDRSDPLDT